MKVLTTCKICPNLELLKDEDIVLTEKMGIDTHFLPNLINCYDESALELALRLKEKDELFQVELIALTVGDNRAELTLKSLRALGFTDTLLAYATDDEIRFSPEIVAETIASYVKEEHVECVFVGQEAPEGNHGIMAQLVAQKIGYPMIGPVIDVLDAKEESITVLVSHAGDVCKQVVKVPCVLCIGNAVISKLRVATLRERMKVSKTESKVIEVKYPADCCMAVPETLEINVKKRMGYQSTNKGEEAMKDILNHGLRKVLESI